MYKRLHKYDSVGSEGKGKQKSKWCTQLAIVEYTFLSYKAEARFGQV